MLSAEMHWGNRDWSDEESSGRSLVGLAWDYEYAPSVVRSVNGYLNSLGNAAKEIASSTCSGRCDRPGKSEVGFSLANDTPKNRPTTDVRSTGTLWSVGGSSLFRKGGCIVDVDCANGTYSYQCRGDFSISDSFTDPFDTTNSIPGDWNPNGVPFPILHSFSRTRSGGGSFR